MDSVLTQRGIQVVRLQTHLYPGDLLGEEAQPAPDDLVSAEARRVASAAGRTIVVLSTAYPGSPQAQGVLAAVSADEPADAGRWLTPVRVSYGRAEPPWSERVVVDLNGRDAAQATEQLLRALGDPPKVAEHLASPEPKYPGVIPPVWRVPARNPSFAERGEVLERIHDQLYSGGPAVVSPVALYGLLGDEATQVALEYAHRFMAGYDVVWWVSSEQAGLIVPPLAELARRLGIRTDPAKPGEAALAAREALRIGQPYDRWLLIFDSADDPDDVRDFLPGGRGHVIVTTRNPAWAQVAEPIEIGVFSRQDSVAFLRRRDQGLTEANAALVAGVLGDLPLAMQHAGAWLQATEMPAADYVALLEDQLAVPAAPSQAPEVPRTVSATCLVSFDRLREQSPAAARLLELCSFFAPGPISMAVLTSDEMLESLRQLGGMDERGGIARLIREMARYSLVTVDRGANAISMHPLVQAVIRGQMTDEYQADTMHEVHRVLAGVRPRQGETDDPANWARYDLIWPHLGPSNAADCEDKEPRQLLIDRVRYQWKLGDYERALSEARELEQRWVDRFGSDHRQVLSLRFHIANVLRSQGNFQAAYELDTATYRSQQRVLPGDDPHTLMTAGGLAADLRAAGRFREALELDEETYTRLKEIFGVGFELTLSSANNLAVGLRLTGDCFRARDLDEETWNYRQRVLGPDHPYTLHSASMLARDLRDAGDYPRSLELLRATYERYLAILGEDFVETLRTAKSLAVSLRKMGMYDEAHEVTGHARARYLTHYGPDHPDSLACTLNLACDLSARDDKPEALELANQVLRTYQASLGMTHPFTLVAENNISVYLRELGSLSEALEGAERALSAMRDGLGERHPFTLACAVNKATCLHDAGDYDAAATLLRETLDQLQKTMGVRYPDTLVCEANLAVTLRASGRMAEAETLQARVITAIAEELGESHPCIVMLREWRLQSIDLEAQPT